MPTSFGSMHEETRPLALLEPETDPEPRTSALGATLASLLLIALPVLAAALL